ncbi:hypothetical protein K3495_g7087 [Podosphaera aphanis]|nr:hypothetical protein K3495_g7087 [Podosphaera aphanis]
MRLNQSVPRLPSPPPPAEIQIGIESPMQAGSSDQESVSMEHSIIEANSKRRIHPGTRSADMTTGLSLIPLNELDSAFQLQEHLKALHYECSKSAHDDATTGPITRVKAKMIATPPDGVDRSLWLYELCRFLINKCNDLVVGLLFDTPPCSSTTCPEMRASEWQFLCAVHETPKTCCAIDYSCHTLDWATNIVTSLKIFPSRLSLGAANVLPEKSAGLSHLTNIFRRLHRIFAHAWFQHRQVYWSVENSTGLYTLFKIVSDEYDLLPADNHQLPPEAEGLEPSEELKPMISILKSSNAHPEFSLAAEEDLANSVNNRNKTRRHIRQSPSVGLAVTTVLEADEDDDSVTRKLEDVQIQENEAEDSDSTEVPGNHGIDSGIENSEAEEEIEGEVEADAEHAEEAEAEAADEVEEVREVKEDNPVSTELNPPVLDTELPTPTEDGSTPKEKPDQGNGDSL